MSKSLTSSHASLLNEREALDVKIRELETKLGEGIITLLQRNNGFKVPYPLLCGALIETLKTLDSQTEKHSEWQDQGEKFLRSINATRKPRTTKNQIMDTQNDNLRAA